MDSRVKLLILIPGPLLTNSYVTSEKFLYIVSSIFLSEIEDNSNNSTL